MKCLIVGCGYIGLALGAELVRRGHAVFGLRREEAAGGDLNAAGIQPLWADITRPETLSALPSEFDWVAHCVASRGGNADDYRRLYLAGTRHVLDWLAPRPPQKLVYTSSTSVYGQTDGSWVEETSPTEPVAATARVLLQTEHELLAAARRQFPAVVLRLAGIYGPRRGYWFHQFLCSTARIEGAGERWLNMIHRDDVVGCLLAALEHGRPGTVYNAVDDEPVSQLNFFGWLARELGRPLPPAADSTPGADRKRGATHKRVSNRKLKTELGYPFQYPTFREGYRAEISRLQSAGRFPPAPEVG